MTTSGPRDAIIVSSANPVIKRVRSLLRRKIRQQERAFIVEGVRAVQDLLDAGVAPQVVEQVKARRAAEAVVAPSE